SMLMERSSNGEFFQLSAPILYPFTGLQSPMRFKKPNCKRLQGAADARRRVRRRTFGLQVPDNKADAVPCERLHRFHYEVYRQHRFFNRYPYSIVQLP
ncbi:MAG: hypothetical protein WAU34_14670, partial [Desulfobacterales bacterium]